MTVLARRLFTTACVLVLLTAAAHTLGHLAAQPANPAEQQLLDQMKGYHLPEMGFGMAPSMYDVLDLLSWFMSLGLGIWGVFGLLLSSAAKRAVPSGVFDRLLQRAALASAGFALALTVACFLRQVPPPMIFLAAVTVCFTFAALLPGRHAGS